MNKPALLALIALVAAVSFAQGDHVPAYNDHPPSAGETYCRSCPKTSYGAKPSSIPYQVQAYELAAKIPSVYVSVAVLLLLRAHRA